MPDRTYWIVQDDGTFITQDDGTQIVLQGAPVTIQATQVRGPFDYRARVGLRRLPPKPL